LFTYAGHDEVDGRVAERLGYRRYGRAITFADIT
jgi:hypothetical protein